MTCAEGSEPDSIIGRSIKEVKIPLWISWYGYESWNINILISWQTCTIYRWSTHFCVHRPRKLSRRNLPSRFFKKYFSYSNVVLDGSISRLFASSSPLWSSSSSQSSCTTTGSTGFQQKHLHHPHDIFKIRHRGKLPWIVYRMPWTQNTHKMLAHSNRGRVLLGKVKVEKKCNFETIVTWSKKTLQMLPMQILKDSINWLVTPCSGSLQLFNLYFDFGFS